MNVEEVKLGQLSLPFLWLLETVFLPLFMKFCVEKKT